MPSMYGGTPLAALPGCAVVMTSSPCVKGNQESVRQRRTPKRSGCLGVSNNAAVRRFTSPVPNGMAMRGSGGRAGRQDRCRRFSCYRQMPQAHRKPRVLPRAVFGLRETECLAICSALASLGGRGGTGRRAALRALWARARGSSSLLDRTIWKTCRRTGGTPQ